MTQVRELTVPQLIMKRRSHNCNRRPDSLQYCQRRRLRWHGALCISTAAIEKWLAPLPLLHPTGAAHELQLPLAKRCDQSGLRLSLSAIVAKTVPHSTVQYTVYRLQNN